MPNEISSEQVWIQVTPLPEVIKKLSPQIETFNVFAKALEGDLPDFSPLYIDVRDLIL